MKIARTLRYLSAAALLAAPQLGWSIFDPVNDDTDIFLANPVISAVRPNVVLFLDNTANWSSDIPTISAPVKSVTELTQSGGTAIATSASNGYRVGDTGVIAGATPAGYNVTTIITGIIDTDRFQFAVSGALASPATGTITVQRTASRIVTALTQASGTATATAVGHGFSIGDTIRITGATETEYNDNFVVSTVPDADTFTFPVSSAAASPATGGPILVTRLPFAKKYDAVKAGLQAFVSGMLTDQFNVGLALFNEQGVTNGFYVRYAARQATAATRPSLRQSIDQLGRTTDNTNNGAFAMGMAEMYTYFAGVSARTGFPAPKRDFRANALSPGGLLFDNALTSSASTTYVSPITDPCQKNYIIVISNGPSTQNTDNDNVLPFLTTLKGVAPTQIALAPSGAEGDWSDEFAEFMANADCNATKDGVQNVFTYTIDILPSGQLAELRHSALLKSMAGKGKGKYFAITDFSTTDQFTDALRTIFNEVQANNSVFASTTLPVSVNVRGTNLNQVYIGVFRPDQNKSPRWLGNLKLYRLGVDTSLNDQPRLFLADAVGAEAEDTANTGFIRGSARSYWTESQLYWGFRAAELNGTGGANDLPDGDLVEKGGAAQQLRLAYPADQSGRNLYTCVNNTFTGPCASGASLSATPFNTTNVSASDLGAFKTYTVDSLSSTGDLATLKLGAAPSPVWSASDTIQISGASPDNFNVSNCALVSADNLTFTYTFRFSACGKTAPDASTVEATSASATPHGLQSGDLVTVSGASNATLDATDAVVSRISNTQFRYPKALAAGINGAITVTGKKLVTGLTSLGGASPTATAVIPSHSYGNVGSTVTLTISGATPNEYNVTGVTATIASADSVTYTVPGTISGTGTTGRATSTNHGFPQGNIVYIQGVTPAEYNTPASVVLNVIDQNTFTYTLPSAATGNGSGALMRASLRIKYIVHGSSNATRDIAKVTLYGSRPPLWTAGTVLIVQGTGGVAPAGYDAPFGTASGSVWTITNVTPDGWDMTYSATGNDNIRAAPSCLKAEAALANPNIPGESATTFFTSCTVMANMYAGRAISSLVNAVQATGTIYSAKPVALTGLSALTTAGGSMSVGRPNDGDTLMQAAIINWVRGADNRDNENSATTPANEDIRPSVHGDVLHSRPAVVNYNRYGDDNDIYAFYGSNDGIFHALKGGIRRHASGPDTGLKPGTERWGFIAREFLGKLKRLREQSPTISNINQKDYFADGSIGVYTKDVPGTGDSQNPGSGTVSGVIGDNADDKVYLFITMRRGGAMIYALDVTNPGNPKLLWRKSSADTGWAELGQSWSEPKIARVRASLGNASNPDNVVLIFGAGYDEAVEDINPCLLNESRLDRVIPKAIPSGGAVTYTTGGCTINPSSPGNAADVMRTKGRGIFVVDAFSGTVVWQAGGGVTTGSSADGTRTIKKLNVPDMTCAIPADVTVLDKDRDANRLADRIYAGDTCGQVWRADIDAASMDEWTVTKIAAVSSTTNTDIANKRKFLFPPDLVFGTDTSNYTAVLLGSGDREHPFDTTVVNRFYMFKDRDGTGTAGRVNETSTKISGFSPAPSGSVLVDSSVFDATNTAVLDGSTGAGLNGWKITLSAGEKVISSATSVAGTVFFNTNQPSATAGGGACGSNLGRAFSYLVGFADAAATTDLNAVGGVTISDRSVEHAGGGYLPSPVPVVVEIDGTKYQAVISGTSVQTPPGLTLERRTRQYWYKEID